MVRLVAAVVLCTLATSFGAVSVVGSAAPYSLVYSDPADLATAIDLPGLATVTESFGMDKAAFEALNPQVIPLDGGPVWGGGQTKQLGSLVVQYSATGTVTFTFPPPGRYSPTFATELGYNYGGASSAGRMAFSGATGSDHISTIVSLADEGAAHNYNSFDATITTTGNKGVGAIGFCVSTRSSISAKACDVIFTLSDGSSGTVALPDFSGSTTHHTFFIGYQAPAGLTITRVQIPDIETGGGSKDNMTMGIDDLSVVMVGASVEGDVDGDGEVSVLDIVAVVTRFGATPADGNWNAACDFDADDEITVLDIVFVVTRFGNTL